MTNHPKRNCRKRSCNDRKRRWWEANRETVCVDLYDGSKTLWISNIIFNKLTMTMALFFVLFIYESRRGQVLCVVFSEHSKFACFEKRKWRENWVKASRNAKIHSTFDVPRRNVKNTLASLHRFSCSLVCGCEQYSHIITTNVRLTFQRWNRNRFCIFVQVLGVMCYHGCLLEHHSTL